MDEKGVAEWCDLVRQARRRLRPEQYKDWCFIVGNNGSPSERYSIGIKALEIISPRVKHYYDLVTEAKRS